MSSHQIVIATGRVSPITVEVPRDDIAALLYVGCTTPILVVAVDRPSVVHDFVLGIGKIDVALQAEESLAILIWRFEFGDYSIPVNTPLHLGLENGSHFPSLSTLGLKPRETRPLAIVIQDEKGIVRRIRNVPMPKLILKRLAPLLLQQLAERSHPDLQHRAAAAFQRFCLRYENPKRAFAAAKTKASVAQ